jgi:pimeloyl-ACP methyl ester carboxylesterase
MSALLIALSMVVALELEPAGQRVRIGTAPGRLIEVQGHELHIHCTGSGPPTVVVDAGAGAWSIFYAHIQKRLTGARVCTYDRAGLGWSAPRPGPRTSDRMVEELHLLLHAAGVQPPLVLVGHSLGGYNVRIYQARYPEEVGALVLLDAAHEEQWERLPPRATDLVRMSAAGMRKRAQQAHAGALQARDVTPPAVLVKHAPELSETYVATMLTATPYETLAAETEDAFESARQVPAGRRVGDLPLVVLTARNSFDAFEGTGIPIEDANAVWQTLQQELAGLSNDSQHLFSDGHHRLNETDPDAVVRAIERAIAAVKRRSGPPPGLGLAAHALPLRSTPEADALLRQLEEAYDAMDAEGFVRLFADDFSQLDVPRRVHVKGREAWIEQTRRINGAHRSMERRHRGRAVVGDWIVAEIEWAGTVRGEALGAPGREVPYRYTGLGLLQVRDGLIARQILYGDQPTLTEQLARPSAPPRR